MGKLHDGIHARLRDFIEAQRVFFVATAPLLGGRVNVSPKGIGGTLLVVDERTVAYLDVTASGAETIAHLREPGNGRITLMFCSFDRSPDVVRLHGTGRVVGLHDPGFADWVARFTETRGARAVVVVDVERVSDSCGYGVPFMVPAGERDLLPALMDRKGTDGIADYRRSKNRTSIDGLPAFTDDDPAPAGQPVGEPVPGWSPREPLAPVTLHGRYVDLVPLEPGHAAALHDATCGDPALWTYLADEMPTSREAFSALVRARVARTDQVALAVVPRGGGPAGMASWLRCDPAQGSVEVGSITFGPALQRTTAATEAMWLMARHAFGLGYRRYEWKCDALNAPSRAAAARLGFGYEGTFRQALVYKGRNRDTAWFSITDRDCALLAPAFDAWLDPANFEDPATGTGQRSSLSNLTRHMLGQQSHSPRPATPRLDLSDGTGER